MRIVDLKCALIGNYPVVRVVTDEGIDGFGQAESYKPYLKPHVLTDLYRDVTTSTSTPIHTGEQIYLRQNFKELFEKQAINIVGPDPADVGGLAELKWVAEYADLHGILMAPHGTGDGLIGLVV